MIDSPPSPPRGVFISLEGGEGAGKSTQTRLLAECLRGLGHDVVQTREVGGSPSAEEIRELWLSKGEGHWDPLTELLLISAARREHLVRAVWPALKRGAWVVTDRFTDSSRAYQGMGLGMGIETVNDLTRHVAGNFEPDLTLLLDLPVETGLARMAERRGPDDRYQQKNVVFHQTLRDAYLKLAAENPQRIVVIDASQNADIVAQAIRSAVATFSARLK
ncbi:MAG: dTMP kinase [Bdellovibrionales bacterium]